jgi:AcrR family transcriptional regulator
MARKGTQSAADAGDTRERILAIASELFAEKGYAGTSIADISGRLGTTKAALYYHFSSKGEILSALLGEFLELSAELVDEAIATPLTPEQILGRLIDLTVDSRGLMATVGRDPSVLSALRAEARRSGSGKQVDVIVSVLVGEDGSRAALIRAHSALAITKESTLAVIADNRGALTEEDRAEILAAALRALSAPAAAMST